MARNSVFSFIVLLLSLLVGFQSSSAVMCRELVDSAYKNERNQSSRAHTNIQKHVSVEVLKIVEQVKMQRADAKTQTEFYKNNLQALRSKLEEEVALHPIASRWTLNKTQALRFRIIRIMQEKLNEIEVQKNYNFHDLLIPTTIVLDLLSDTWSTSIFYRGIPKDKVSELMDIENDQELFQKYRKDVLQRHMTTSGTGMHKIAELSDFKDGWQMVAMETGLSAADLVYLNLNGIAPLWISYKTMIVDGERLSPMRIFMHDVFHYKRQTGEDIYYTPDFSQKLKSLKEKESLIIKLNSLRSDAVTIAASFVVTHEIDNYKNSQNFIDGIWNWKPRFSSQSDLFEIYRKYSEETGKDLDSFINEISQLLKQLD